MRLINIWNVLEGNKFTKVDVHVLDPESEQEKTCVTLMGMTLLEPIANYEIVGLNKSLSKKGVDRITYDCYIFEQDGKQEPLTLGKVVPLWQKVAPDMSVLQVDFSIDYNCPTFTFNKEQSVPNVLYWTAIQSIFIDFRGRLTILLQE